MKVPDPPLTPDFSLEAVRIGPGARAESSLELFLERTWNFRLEACPSRNESNPAYHRQEGFGMRWVQQKSQEYFFEEGLDPDRILELARGDRPPAQGEGNRSPHTSGPRAHQDFRGDRYLREVFSGVSERVFKFALDRLPADTRLVVEWRCRQIQVARAGEDLRNDCRERVVMTLTSPGPTGRTFGVGVESLETLREPRRVENLLEDLSPASESKESLRPAPTGEWPVVLAPGTGGVFLHEACGHPLEADLVLRRLSPFREKLGSRVAADFVEVVDDPSRTGLEGSYAFDDEGAAARSTILIRRGILRSFLTDGVTALQLNHPVTGNGRRESFRDLPLPRMSNLYLRPGPHSREEILKETPRGIFIEYLGGGRVDPNTGDFLFRAEAGRLIEAGRLTAPLRPFRVAGNCVRALAAIDRVGRDLSFGTGAGSCGKEGQRVPVAVGIPTLRVRTLTVRPD